MKPNLSPLVVVVSHQVNWPVSLLAKLPAELRENEPIARLANKLTIESVTNSNRSYYIRIVSQLQMSRPFFSFG